MSEQKKVLIVDDDMNMHEFYAGLFSDHAVTYTTSVFIHNECRPGHDLRRGLHLGDIVHAAQKGEDQAAKGQGRLHVPAVGIRVRGDRGKDDRGAEL